MEISTEDLLQGAAGRGDARADALVQSLAHGVPVQELLQRLQGTIRFASRLHLDPDLLGLRSAERHTFEQFLHEIAQPPAWIRPDDVAAGAQLFRKHVSVASLALGAASLPTCYCWSQEAAVLMHTQRLAQDVPRRVLETAQFVLDVMSPHALVLGGRSFPRGVRAAQKIRTLHAVVRYMLRERPALYAAARARFTFRTREELIALAPAHPWLAFLVPAAGADAPAAYEGVAINQEELAGTLLTFSIVILGALQILGIKVTRAEADAYLHAWNVVGYLLGIEQPLLERTGSLERADELRSAIMRRHRRYTPDTHALQHALSHYLSDDIDLVFGLHRWLPARRIPRLTMGMLLEAETLQAVGVTLDPVDRRLNLLFRPLMRGLGKLQNVPWVGKLSKVLFGYLSKKVWAWRNVPFSAAPAPVARIDAAAAEPLANWSDTLSTSPAKVAHPSSTDEISAILRDTAQYPSPVVVMGSYHSTTPCASADAGTVIRLDRMRRVLEIGPDYVEAEAGALYIDVAHELHRRDLEFYVNLQIGNITLGAAACSTTKDGSFPGEYAQASSYCISMTVVAPDGTVQRIDESKPELMRAARCSHGLLGVVCAVRFRVRPIEPVSIEHRTMSVEQFLQALPELKAAGGSLEYYLYPFIDRVTVQLRRKSSAPGPVNKWVWKLRNFSVSRVVPLAAHAIEAIPGRWLRDAVSALNYRIAGASLQWICHAAKTYASGQTTRYLEPPGRYGFTFALWGFPEERFPQILRDYIALSKRHYAQTGYRSHMLTVGYVVSRDANALLSYSSSGQVITIDPTGFGGEGWDEYLDAYNDFCCDRGGVPLLNQTPRLEPEHVRRAFGERLAQFEALRRSIDPGNRLLNAYFAGLLQDAGS